MDMLGHAPTPLDFNLRVTALDLTVEEVRPYLEVFMLRQGEVR